MCPEIRAFEPEDSETVREVHTAAFGGREDEARLVETLHAAGASSVSLVAVEEASDNVIGHLLFSPVEIEGGGPSISVVGLAPIGILPEFQRKGVGSQLIRAGLEACQEARYDAVVLLGEPDYYSRFGFGRASGYGLGNEYGVDEHFMVLELRSGALGSSSGIVRYRPEFGKVGV